MKMFRSVTALAVAGGVLATGSLAVAAGSTPQGGAIRAFSTQTTEIKGKITITGAIGDFGTTISQDKNGKPDANGAYTKVTLKHGGFIINSTGLEKKLQHAKPQVNLSNCSVVFSGSGPGTIGSGTGAYQGISGTVSIVLTFAGIAPKKGSGCDLSDSAPTYGAYASITAKGHVSFS
jgi:hypothetical protein